MDRTESEVRDAARHDDESHEFEERVVQINRVSKVVKGGRRFSFGSHRRRRRRQGPRRRRLRQGRRSARLDPQGRRERPRRTLITVPLDGTTIPHEIETSFGASRVLLKPAAPGTGVIAGGGVRAVLEAAGIKDVLTKSLGSNNPVNVVERRMKALKQLESAQAVAAPPSTRRRCFADRPRTRRRRLRLVRRDRFRRGCSARQRARDRGRGGASRSGTRPRNEQQS